jgi:hypothetical protein
MKHKHCDLIKAWADGAEIQCRKHNSDWADIVGGSPSWFHEWEYRIKPKTIKYRLALIQGWDYPWVNAAMSKAEAANMEDTSSFVRWLSDWQEVEV